MPLYELVSEDISQVGGPMGMVSTSTNFRKLFGNLRAAKTFAEKDYNQSRGPIEWTLDRYKQWHSQDLGYVMYWIRPVKVHS